MQEQSRQYATSRRTKAQQQKILKQTAFFIVMAIIVFTLFFGLVLPNVIKLASNASKTTAIASQDDGIKPEIPLISVPVPATASATLTLNGYSLPKYTVTVVQNGQDGPKAQINNDESFKVDVPLQKGDNHLTLYATDDKGNKSDSTPEYVVTLLTDPPQLTVSQPKDKDQIQGKNNQNMTIKGITDKNVKILVNDHFVFVKDDGTFATLLMLNSGDNTVDIKAVDLAGNTTENKLAVNYHD